MNLEEDYKRFIGIPGILDVLPLTGDWLKDKELYIEMTRDLSEDD